MAVSISHQMQNTLGNGFSETEIEDSSYRIKTDSLASMSFFFFYSGAEP